MPEPDREAVEHLLHLVGRQPAEQHRPHEIVDELRIDAATGVGELDQRDRVRAYIVGPAPQRGDVEAEPAPPHGGAARGGVDVGEDRLGPIDLTGFEREPGRVRPMPERRSAAGRVAMGAQCLVDVRQRGAEVAFPFGEVGEAVPVAAGEEVESGALGRVAHPQQQRSRLVGVGPVVVAAHEVVQPAGDEHPEPKSRPRRSTRRGAPRPLAPSSVG